MAFPNNKAQYYTMNHETAVWAAFHHRPIPNSERYSNRLCFVFDTTIAITGRLYIIVMATWARIHVYSYMATFLGLMGMANAIL